MVITIENRHGDPSSILDETVFHILVKIMHPTTPSSYG